LQEEEKLRLLHGNWKISLDGLQIARHEMIEAMFTNRPPARLLRGEPNYRPKRYITCDAARYGRDYCVIMVWEDWTCIHMIVYKKSAVQDVVTRIEKLRLQYTIPLDCVMVDQDGVGGDYVAIGKYEGFRGNSPIVRDDQTRIKENYFNFKTQCYYRLCEKRINTGEISFEITNSTCEIYETSDGHPQYSTKILWNGKMWDVRDMLKADLRTVRRSDTDKEGKLKIEPKEIQKDTLRRSPDFGDTAMMREAFELLPRTLTMRRKN
jgi:hypothetical protein